MQPYNITNTILDLLMFLLLLLQHPSQYSIGGKIDHQHDPHEEHLDDLLLHDDQRTPTIAGDIMRRNIF